MRVLSLFSGGGGGDLGLVRAGFSIAGHCEIEPHAQAVLRYHYPDVPLHDDVTTLDGTAYRGRVELVVGGSPCQDLSVAGKRAGLAGERSGLFFEQVRVWEETGAPTMIWENVGGALSSNEGRDFALVLGTLVGGTVPVPKDGWGGAGVAAGPGGVAAWRVIDLQYFGPPQRRRRVFVVASRAGGVDPEAVLLELAGMPGDPETRREAWEEAARAARGGAQGGGSGGAGGGAIGFDWQNSPSQGMTVRAEAVDALRTKSVPAALAFNSKQDASDADQVAPTLLAMPHDKSHANGGGQLAVCVTGERTHALTSEGADASEDGTGRGTPIVLASGQANAERSTNGVAPTLTLLHEAPIVAGTLAASGAGTARPAGQKNETDLIVVGTLTPGAHPGGANGQDAYTGHLIPSAGRPRRLMPIECERLQGWPDEWTRYGRREDGTVYELSDSARYRIIGNGIGAPHFHWIGLRMREAAGWD